MTVFQTRTNLQLTPYLRALCVLALSWAMSALAADEHAGHHMMMMEAAPAACAQPTLACATAATPYLAPDGSLWLAWMAGGKVSVARSTDLGHSFGPTVAITPKPARLDNGPDSRPAIIVDAAKQVFVAYAIFKDDAYNGQVLYARSTDGGTTYSPPAPITDNRESQRFTALALDPDGRVFAAWLDKRGRVAAKKAGKDYAGAGLAFAWFDPAGNRFDPARIVKDDTCECCRIGVAFAGPGRPVVVFRNIFEGGIRDHAITTFSEASTPGPVYRVSVDNWKIDACPHHGPSLAVAPDGTYHVAWFTEGSARKGLFYARSRDGGRSFSAPMALGDPAHQLSRPRVLAVGNRVWLAWKEFDGTRTTINIKQSGDGGANWSPPKVVAETADASDQPILISDGRRAFLSWLANVEGYRLLPLDDTL